MLGYLILVVVGIILLPRIVERIAIFKRNIDVCRQSGLPYLLTPLNGNPGEWWQAVHELFLPTLWKLPISRDWLWPKAIDPHYGWMFPRLLNDALGDTYMTASFNKQPYLSVANAEAIAQIASRKTDFEKPVEVYKVVDIYGDNILTTEGPDWRRHRKIVAPAFTEKSNSLVWQESSRQAEGMMAAWERLPDNDKNMMIVRDTSIDTQMLALHVISSAGFGVPQVFPGDDRYISEDKIVPGFNSSKLLDNHTMSFRESLNLMVHSVIWMAIFPIWFLAKSPFKMHQTLLKAHSELGNYFTELVNYRLEKMESGNQERDSVDLMGPMIASIDGGDKDSARRSGGLTKQEIVADSWIFLFAGHETSANVLHFSLLYLAIDREAQRQLQADIDRIAAGREPNRWTYGDDMKQFYNSMIGATMNETLRLIPPVISIPKIVREAPQDIQIDGKTYTIPPNTFVHFNVLGIHKNPRYWPHSSSKITKDATDLNDFVPQRWLQGSKQSDNRPGPNDAHVDGLEAASFETAGNLFTPVKGAFVPFSEGPRSCPGRRFAQVEITAVLARIFHSYSIELDVGKWMSYGDIDRATVEEKQRTYDLAKARANRLILESESMITLKMEGKERVPIRLVKRGQERFAGC